MSYIKEEKPRFFLPRKTPIGSHRLHGDICPSCGRKLGQYEPSKAGMGIIGWILVALIVFTSYKVLSSSGRKETKRYFRRKVKSLPIPR